MRSDEEKPAHGPWRILKHGARPLLGGALVRRDDGRFEGVVVVAAVSGEAARYPPHEAICPRAFARASFG
ncbi:MAG TPA: hypothetical protein VK730_11150 [Solirubrobacteraceae bacterium]|nr:hypothetical protein [Solirubrobacteraceae bacterium]